MKVSQNEATILRSAKKLFKKKGLNGTTVQEIATDAGTTKSMVNYYFRSKEKLFISIFHQEFKSLFSGLLSFLSSELSLREKIEKIVELDIDRLRQIPDLPIFILTEVNHNPEIVFRNLDEFPVHHLLAELNKQIAIEVKKGVIKKIQGEELLLNIQCLTIFPFAAKPMLMKIFRLNKPSFETMLDVRKKQIPELIWQSIKK